MTNNNLNDALIKLMTIIDEQEIREQYNINEHEYNELSKQIAQNKKSLDRIQLIKKIHYIYPEIDITNSNVNIKLNKGSKLYDFYSNAFYETVFDNLPYLLDIDDDNKILHFKCNCSTRTTIKNIDVISKVYVYRIQDVSFHNPIFSDDDF